MASPDECVLIGDTLNDALGAMRAETPFIAVTYGFGFQNPDEISAYPNIGIARNPIEIANFIL